MALARKGWLGRVKKKEGRSPPSLLLLRLHLPKLLRHRPGPAILSGLGDLDLVDVLSLEAGNAPVQVVENVAGGSVGGVGDGNSRAGVDTDRFQLHRYAPSGTRCLRGGRF